MRTTKQIRLDNETLVLAEAAGTKMGMKISPALNFIAFAVQESAKKHLGKIEEPATRKPTKEERDALVAASRAEWGQDEPSN